MWRIENQTFIIYDSKITLHFNFLATLSIAADVPVWSDSVL